jgi:hypothetical protein
LELNWEVDHDGFMHLQFSQKGVWHTMAHLVALSCNEIAKQI